MPKKKIRKQNKPASQPENIRRTKIRVVGIGGGGGNIVAEIASRVKGASFVIANTDKQAIKESGLSKNIFQFGESLTHGLGTGMNPEAGRAAAESDKERIKKILQDQDLVILIATLGGGAGSGAVPVFAQVSRNLKNLTFGIFTLPFKFEGERKMEIALASLEQLRPNLNAFVLLPNERIFQIVDKNTPLTKAFLAINKILSESLGGLIRTVFSPGLINIDFADLKTVLNSRGKLAYLNIVEVPKSETSAKDCIEKLLNSPLYPYGIRGAKGVIFNIEGEKDLKLDEIRQISEGVAKVASKDAKIIFGVAQGGSNKNLIKTTLLATGCCLKIDREPVSQVKKIVKKEVKKQEKRKRRSVPKPKTGKVVQAPPIAEPVSQAGAPTKEQGTSLFGEKTDLKIRKNALQVKEEVEEEEAKMLAEEKFWETPPFLRGKRLS
ncbi:MAG: cell division protein FtsZ [bacterium]